MTTIPIHRIWECKGEKVQVRESYRKYFTRPSKYVPPLAPPPLPVSHSRKTMGIKIKVIILLSIHFWPAALPGCTEETPGSPRPSPGQWPQSLWVGCELEAATSQTLRMSLKGFCLPGSGHMVSLLSTLPAKKPKILLKWICEATASNSTSQIPWGIEPA